MVAPNYAAQRSKFAKQIGLGHRDEDGSTAGRLKKQHRGPTT
jgi:predicted transcriptional regulator